MGDATPDGIQHLLHRAKWDADAVRDDIRAYVVERAAYGAVAPPRAWEGGGGSSG